MNEIVSMIGNTNINSVSISLCTLYRPIDRMAYTFGFISSFSAVLFLSLVCLLVSFFFFSHSLLFISYIQPFPIKVFIVYFRGCLWAFLRYIRKCSSILFTLYYHSKDVNRNRRQDNRRSKINKPVLNWHYVAISSIHMWICEMYVCFGGAHCAHRSIDIFIEIFDWWQIQHRMDNGKKDGYH